MWSAKPTPPTGRWQAFKPAEVQAEAPLTVPWGRGSRMAGAVQVQLRAVLGGFDRPATHALVLRALLAARAGAPSTAGLLFVWGVPAVPVGKPDGGAGLLVFGLTASSLAHVATLRPVSRAACTTWTDLLGAADETPNTGLRGGRAEAWETALRERGHRGPFVRAVEALATAAEQLEQTGALTSAIRRTA